MAKKENLSYHSMPRAAIRQSFLLHAGQFTHAKKQRKKQLCFSAELL